MMTQQRLALPLAAALLAFTFGSANAQAPAAIASKADEAKLIEVLKSDAPYKAKNDACRALALDGSKDAVPALAAMLPDAKLSHIARIALEQIHDPSVNAALLAALTKTQGLPLIGVMSSLGNLREVSAIAPIAKLLNDPDAEVASQAAQSLGRIGTPASARALMTALAKPTPAVYDGLLRCAETLSPKDAAAIYDALRKPPAPQPIRMAALRSAIVVRHEGGLPLLLETLRGNDNALSLAGMAAARELQGAGVTSALANEVKGGKLAADRQLVLVQVLGARRDKVAGPVLAALAHTGDGNLRTAALKSLVQIGDAASLPLLVELAVADDADVAKLARTGLAGFTGREAEAPIAGMLRSTNPKARQVAADLMVQRRMLGAIPQLLLAANDADPAVATASIQAIGAMGGNAEAPALIKLLTAGTATPAAESALVAIYSRTHDTSAADTLAAALPAASPTAKVSLMRVLRQVGGPKALAEIRTAMADTNADVRENAMRNLGDWPTVDALPDLLTLVKTPPSPTIKILALRGLIRLIPMQNVASDQKVASLKEALGLADRPEEKRLALAALGGVPTADSLALVVPQLADAALKEEASAAAIAIGEQLTKTQPAVVSDAMKQVIAATKDDKLIKRAQALVH